MKINVLSLLCQTPSCRSCLFVCQDSEMMWTADVACTWEKNNHKLKFIGSLKKDLFKFYQTVVH